MHRLTSFAGLLLGLACVASADAYPKTPEWVRRQVEDISIQVPAGWTYLEAPDLARQGIQIPPEERAKAVLYFLTFPGKEFLASDCLIGMGRVSKVELDQFGVLPGSDTITVAGQQATRYRLERGTGDDMMRGILLVMQTPHADGKQIGLVFFCKAKVWVSYEPVFTYMVSTLTIGSGTAPPPTNGLAGVVTSNTVPVADVTVLVGENLKLKIDAGYSDVLQGTALFLETKTDAKGQFALPLPPGFYSVVFWKKGFTPVVFERVPSPPGRLATEIGVDAQPGNTGRHQGIVTAGVPNETPLGQPGVTGVRGRIRVMDQGNPIRSDGVTILVGQDLTLLGDSPTDTVLGTQLLAEVSTDAQGRFYLPLPPGNYGLLVWKQGHVPIHGINVTVRPNSYFRPQADYPRMAPNDIGVFNSDLMYDRQVGAASRHVDLDLDRVPKGPAGAAGTVVVSGTIRLSDRGLRLPGADAQVIYGHDLTVASGATVRVRGRDIATSTADAQGRYTLRVKSGRYQVVVFKAGFRVDPPIEVAVPEQGGLNKTLLRDRSPGAERQELLIEQLAPGQSSRRPVPLPVAGLWPVLFAEVAAPPAHLTERRSGDATVAVPADWKPEAGLPEDEARWCRGDPAAPQAALAVLRDEDFSGLIDSLQGRMRTWIQVDGQEASLYEGETPAKERALLLIVGKARPDGRKVALFATAQADVWQAEEPLLREAVTSLRLAGRPQPPVVVTPPMPPQPPVVVDPGPQPPVGPEVRLPTDPREPVVIFDYVGGLTLPRKTKDPMLIIRAGGRVTLIDPFGQVPTVETTITRENLQKFMEFALVERKFFSIDGQAIEQQIKEAQRRGGVIITDLPKTIIHLRTDKSEWRVSVAGPGMYLEHFPHIKGLKDLAAIAARLEEYVDKLREPGRR